MEKTEGRVREPDHRSIEFIQFEKQRKNRWRKKQSPGTLGTNMKTSQVR